MQEQEPLPTLPVKVVQDKAARRGFALRIVMGGKPVLCQVGTGKTTDLTEFRMSPSKGNPPGL